MRLVGEAALNCDLAQWLVGRQHEALRPLHPAAHDVVVRGVADTVAERSVEVEFAEVSNRGEIPVSNRCIKVRVDVSQNASNLPRCEAMGRSCERSRRGLFHSLKDGLRVTIIATGFEPREEAIPSTGTVLGFESFVNPKFNTDKAKSSEQAPAENPESDIFTRLSDGQYEIPAYMRKKLASKPFHN
jgi:hypothetical protein